MSKAPVMLVCVLLVGGLSWAESPGSTAYALDTESDVQCTEVRYSVDATVVFTSDDIHMVQKVPVGQFLIAPQVKEKPGYTFAGWIDAATGDFWDFSSPVTGDLRLIARYMQDVLPTQPSQPTHGTTSLPARSAAGQIAKTADATPSPTLSAALAGVGLAAVACSAFVLYKLGNREYVC